MASRDIAVRAGRMGAVARARGALVPVPDLLIAATAITLDIPLLTCDSDFGRGSGLGGRAGDWARLRLHPASDV
jgi:predicted nucleic acid-binding protein